MQNLFETKGNWYRGALHAHTKNSDGALSVQEIIELYRRNGFDFLAITDHNVIVDATEFSREDFLVLRGVEWSAQYHLVALDLPMGLKLPSNSMKAQEAVQFIHSNGGEVILAHPYWSGLTINDLMGFSGYLGIEVFNTSCLKEVGRGLSSVHWDELSDRGRVTFGFAVDDAHGYHDALGGWVMVKAPSLTGEDIMEAVRKGFFYSSCGPQFSAFSFSEGVIRVGCSPVEAINFISNPSGLGKRIEAQGKSPLIGGEYDLNRHSEEVRRKISYVRVECEDAYGGRAWLNPLALK